jgi:hypothetical protein
MKTCLLCEINNLLNQLIIILDCRIRSVIIYVIVLVRPAMLVVGLRFISCLRKSKCQARRLYKRNFF